MQATYLNRLETIPYIAYISLNESKKLDLLTLSAEKVSKSKSFIRLNNSHRHKSFWLFSLTKHCTEIVVTDIV